MTYGHDVPFKDYHDLSQILTEQYNEFMVTIGIYDEFAADDVMAYLKTMDSETMLNDMIDSDYGRGLLMGQIMAHIYLAQEAALKDSVDEEDTEDES